MSLNDVYHFTSHEILLDWINQETPFLIQNRNTFPVSGHPAMFDQFSGRTTVRITIDADKISPIYSIRYLYNKKARTGQSHSEEDHYLEIECPVNIKDYIIHVHCYLKNDITLYKEIDKKLTDLGICHREGRALTYGPPEPFDEKEYMRRQNESFKNALKTKRNMI